MFPSHEWRTHGTVTPRPPGRRVRGYRPRGDEGLGRVRISPKATVCQKASLYLHELHLGSQRGNSPRLYSKRGAKVSTHCKRKQPTSAQGANEFRNNRAQTKENKISALIFPQNSASTSITFLHGDGPPRVPPPQTAKRLACIGEHRKAAAHNASQGARPHQTPVCAADPSFRPAATRMPARCKATNASLCAKGKSP